MSLHTYIVRRGATYRFRCRVPRDLRSRVGRAELSRSLRTTCRFTAKSRAAPLYTLIERLWTAVRQTMDSTEINRLIERWLMAELDKDIAVWADQSFAADDAARHGISVHEAAASLLRMDAETSLERWQAVAEGHEWVAGETLANAFISEHHLPIDRGSAVYKSLCMGLCLARVDLEGVRVERSLGHWHAKPQIYSEIAAVSQLREVRVSAAPASETIGELISKFLAEVEQTRRYRPKRLMDFATALKLLVRQLGGRPVNQVTKKEIGDFRLLLTSLPPNFTKRFGTLDLSAIAAKVKQDGLATLDPQTINTKYLAVVEDFFAWCVSCGIVAENAAKGVRLKMPKTRSDRPRGTFKQQHLEKLFAAPLYSGCKSEGRIYEAGDHLVRDHRFWLPVLGLWTGARLGELCQLLITDVREIDGIWCIEIKGGGDKHVKSRAAERRIPIHPELLQSGFVDHVRQLARDGKTRIFPDIEVGAGGYLSDTTSKWFRRFLLHTLGAKTVGIDKLVFHSFRHTMKDALREAGVGERVQDALLGHETDHVSSQYGEGYKVRRLFEEITKVSHNGTALVKPQINEGAHERPSPNGPPALNLGASR